MKKENCDICGDTATHFPVFDWAGTAEPYCCYCFNGSPNCLECQKD